MLELLVERRLTANNRACLEVALQEGRDEILDRFRFDAEFVEGAQIVIELLDPVFFVGIDPEVLRGEVEFFDIFVYKADFDEVRGGDARAPEQVLGVNLLEIFR
jgi:hypothetical protein